MLRITNPSDTPLPGALQSPGGFSWWYVDLLDDRGNGVVAIASWGLPFLPGYASAARRGKAREAGERPSIALSIYEAGVCVYYLLQELPPDQAAADGHSLTFGRSTLAFTNGSLDARLDLDGPGGRLQGTLQVRGTPRQPVDAAPLDHDQHEWCPLSGPAHGRWNLEMSDRSFSGEGSAYIDRNAGLGSLEDLGVARWTWARAVVGDRTRIAYALWNAQGECKATLVDIHADGRCEARPAQVVTTPERSNLWGLRWRPTLSLVAEDRWMQVHVEHRPDDGPFYQRTLCKVETEVGTAPGVGEVCDTHRIDRDWQRPLIAMCVHRPEGPNSMWLPLFAGPRQGRIARLLGVA